MKIIGIRHLWPEKAGFTISRPNGLKYYTFLHFLSRIDIEINGETVSGEPGACIIYSPGVPQYFKSENHDIIHNWAHMDESFKILIDKYSVPTDVILYPKGDSFITEIFHRGESEFFMSQNTDSRLSELYMEELMIKLSRSIGDSTPEKSIDRKNMEKFTEIRTRILSNPAEKWSIEKMAELAFLSPSRFHAMYKSAFSTSPMQDLIFARVRYAETLLHNDNGSISSIAEKCGYNDEYHFIRQFKAVTGITPGAYRQSFLK